MAYRGRDKRTLRWWEVQKAARLAWRLFRDPHVPLLLKFIPLAAVIYVIFPLDILPDIVPPLGQVDDLTLLLGALYLFIRLCPPEVVARYQEAVSSPSNVSEEVIEGEWWPVEADKESGS